MGQVKEINIKNWTYYFFNDMIKIDVFDPNLLEIDKKSNKNIDVYYIGYITIKKLIIMRSRWTYWKKNGSKYLVFDSTDENRKVLKNTQNFGIRLNMKLRQLMVVKTVNW